MNYEGADASYFATVGLPILRGRAINEQDRAGSEPVAVVNEAFAHLFWPGKDPIGRRIKWGSSKSHEPWLTVVGLVPDTRYRELIKVRPSVYVPYEHGIPVSPGYLAVRGSSPAIVAGAIRRTVANLEPAATIVSIEPVPHLLTAPLARPRFQTTVATWFAAVALLLSIAGTYAMLSLLVRQRRREIGIRIALGARPSNVRRLVLRHGLTIGGVGVLLGTASTLIAGRLIQVLLFEVTAADPFVLVGTAVLMAISILAATLLPTQFAAQTSPLLVMRSE